MKLPATIKVGYRDYTVEAWEPITASANRRLGESDHFGLMIRVRADIPAQIKAEVLLHEILHCAWWVGAVEDKDDEERTVSVVANVMSQVWRDNPEFVAFMSECLSTKPAASDGPSLDKLLEGHDPAKNHGETQW